MTIVYLVVGLILGSFIAAFAYRMPRGLSMGGRSICPTCKKTIRWYDNIPVLSYLLLKGKCRHCHKRISPRYPLIELFAASVFLVFFQFSGAIAENIRWLGSSQLFSLFILAIIAFVMVSIFVIDAEHQIIPDVLVFSLWGIVVSVMILGGYTNIYHHISAGFLSALFLLLINMATGGKGMGLGDVKLAIVVGTILGPVLTVVWLFTSFILGGIIASFLLLFGKAQFKDKVAFGPFLVLSFFVMLIFGNAMSQYLLPYIQ